MGIEDGRTEDQKTCTPLLNFLSEIVRKRAEEGNTPTNSSLYLIQYLYLENVRTQISTFETFLPH